MIEIIKKEKQTNPGQSRMSEVYIKFKLKYFKDLKYI